MTTAGSTTVGTTLTGTRAGTRLLAAIAVAVIIAAGCGADAGSPPERAYVVELHIEDSEEEYDYVPDEPFDIKVGDEVTFRIRNTGDLPHDVQVVDPNGKQVATGPVADPGEVTEAVVRFDEAGIYQLNCLVDDHLMGHRMQALIQADEVA
jgi:plastocyanin